MNKTCPPNKVLNPRSNRCIKKTGKLAEKLGLNTNNKIIQNPSKNQNTKKCPPNKVLNSRSNRCIKKKGKLAQQLGLTTLSPPKRKFIKKKKVRFKEPTPSVLIRQKSYSPSINKTLVSSESIDKDANIFQCKMDEINTKLKSDKYKCYKWNSKKAKDIMLKNLKSRRKISPHQIIGPKQTYNNCWFNTFFMAFFISDKGRKFLKYFRQSMITGILPNGNKIPIRIHKILFIFNKLIEACLIGNKDLNMYMTSIDTNYLVDLIYKHMKIGNPSGRYGNGVEYFNKLISHFKVNDVVEYATVYPNVATSLLFLRNKATKITKQKFKPPHVFIIVRSNYGIYKHTVNESVQKSYTDKIENKKYKYELDAAIIRDISNNHFIVFLTFNGEDYVFDGQNNMYIHLITWKNKINKNENIKIGTKTYNFKKCLSYLFYYRTL